jgi:hypothetical protein
MKTRITESEVIVSASGRAPTRAIASETERGSLSPAAQSLKSRAVNGGSRRANFYPSGEIIGSGIEGCDLARNGRQHRKIGQAFLQVRANPPLQLAFGFRHQFVSRQPS